MKDRHLLRRAALIRLAAYVDSFDASDAAASPELVCG
jgi:hypothetical protein